MLRFMKNKILIPLLILGALATFFSFRYSGTTDADENKRKQIVLETVMEAIRQGHFSPRAIDDSLSYKVYHKILENLDYDKKFFTQQDIDQLNAYEYKIDDQIKDGSVEFFDKLSAIFTRRIKDAEGYYKTILDNPFTFNGNDSIQLNGDKLAYASGEAELKNRWTQYLKYRVLAKYVDLKKEQEKSKEDKDNKDKVAKVKTDAELEKEARVSVRKNQDSYFKRLNKINENERFAIYVNSITSSQDPHTDYLPPRDKQRFDEAMSGTFFGIGAQLKDEEGKIKVAAIITGSPSWKQGDLKAGDEIIKVGQGKEEPIDIQGFDIDDAVQKIRGKKGTEVRLTVKRVDGSTKVIPIVRGEVMLEEVFAKSAIIQSPGGPVGYIYLPEFYADFQKINGRRSAEDVAIEVQKLKNAGVAGIILDLRNNGGGSLNDVVDMAGLFIDKGPIVQVKTSGTVAETLSDKNTGILYDGPLAIMVNQNSASASEIMAAAMQDYKRAVVVGSPTFGKGTVQRLISLDDMLNRSNPLSAMAGHSVINDAPIGSLKITVQKFYRVNGGSTQLKGVIPDIILPDPYQGIEMGERRDKSALKWDEIPAANYRPVSNPVNVAELAAMSKKRTATSPAFSLVEESAKRIKDKEKYNAYPLNEVAYRKELDEANATSKKMEELEKKTTLLTIVNAKEDMANIKRDSSSIAKNADWIKNLQKDMYLSETVNIVNDLMKGQSRVNLGTGMK